MTTETKIIKIQTTEISSYQCDRCLISFDPDTDAFEVQEMLNINILGGYGSVFGDGVRRTLDLCQSCQQEILAEYFQYPDELRGKHHE